jgi:hypothetical protein
MQLGRVHRIFATIAVGGMLIAGCGGGGEGEKGGNAAYEELLHGLKQAAASNTGYNAVERAKDLKSTLRASIDAFCETNQEMLLNSEAWKAKEEAYYVVRIKLRAERELPYLSTRPVAVAVRKYQSLFDLASFDPSAVRRYSKACYH